MMQIEFNVNNFIFYGVSATAWLAYPIMTSFRYVPDVACVALDENPT